MTDKIVAYLNSLEATYPKAWDGLKIFLIGSPPIYVAYCTSRIELPLQEAVQSFAKTHPYTILTAFLSPIVFTAVFRCLDIAFNNLRHKDLIPKVFIASMLSAFRNVASQRLISSNKIAKSLTDKTTKAEIFDHIADAKTHNEILINLHNIIREMTRDNSLQLILVKMRQNLPYDWYEFIPKDIMLPPNLLTEHANKTLFHYAAKKKEPIIIRDIAKYISTHKKNRQYHPLGNANYDKGSIVCYPIEHQLINDVAYTLSVKSDTPGMIVPSLVDAINDVVRVFKMQLVIEHNFDYIKERVT